MTTWLEFRAEPMMDVPEVKTYRNAEVFIAVCQGENCNWRQQDLAQDREDFYDDVAKHKQWHEDGMPE